MNDQLPSRRLRFLPHLSGTTRADLPRDFLAGLTVAAIAIPQALAYAYVAGLPPEMGLLAAAAPAAVAALFGASPHLVSGPTNPTALLLGASVVAPALAAGRGVPVADVLVTGLLVGLILIGFASIGVGRASRFLSDSVVVGFTTGVGLLIALSLMPELSGGPRIAPIANGWVPEAWPRVVAAARAMTDAPAQALFLFAIVPTIILGLRRINPLVPGALIALTLATVLTRSFGWARGEAALSVVGHFSWQFNAPDFTDAASPGSLTGPAVAIALLVAVQSIASARAIRPPGTPALDVDRELVAQGLSNLTAAATGAMVTSGSFTRTSVARSAGGRSRATALFSALAVLVAAPLFAPLIALVPMAALAGLVALSGVELISARGLRRAVTTRGDAGVLVVTLAATLCLDLVQALYVGVFLSLALLVRRSGDLMMVELVRSDGGRFREVPLDDDTGRTPAVLLHLEGDLNFAVAGDLKERLEEIGRRGPRVMTLRLKRARHLDATCIEALREATGVLQDAGIKVLLCGLSNRQVARIARTELGQLLGDDGLLRAGERLFEGFEHALERTREELAPATADEIFRGQGGADWLDEI